MKIKKVLATTAISIIVLIVTSIGGGIIFFLNLDNLHTFIDKQIFKASGYHFSYHKLSTGFNHLLQPQITIEKLELNQPDNSQPLIAVDKIEVALSYATLIKFMPVLSNLTFSGTRLSLEYDKAGNVTLNSHILTNYNAKSTTNAKLDFEALLLAQQNISLSNVDVLLLDSKYYPQQFKLGAIAAIFKNNGANHMLKGSLTFANRTRLKLDSSWDGTSLWDIRKWQTGVVKLNTLNTKGYLLNLNARIKDGVINQLSSKFDSNKQNFAKYDDSIQNLTNFAGGLIISQTKPDYYVISGQKLTINTKDGYLLNNASLNGWYQERVGGVLDFKTVNLAGINSILHTFPVTSKLTLSGLAAFGIKWQNSVLGPKNITLNTTIDKLGLLSRESSIPSINNLNAVINAGSTGGAATISLHNSQLSYPKQLANSVMIKAFKSNLSWQVESWPHFMVKWESSTLATPDFAATSSGSYRHESNILHLLLDVANLKLPAISKYLPQILPVGVIDYTRQSILQGTVTNAHLLFDGAINQFPFKESQDVFSLTANIRDGSYRFLQQWGSISHINAKLQMNSQNLHFSADSAYAGHIMLNKGSMIITRWSESSAQLAFTVQANGATNDYLGYLKVSPFAQELTAIDDKLTINGNGLLNLQLFLPFNDLRKFQLAGKFTPVNNRLDLAAFPLTINAINGNVNFTQTGLSQSVVTAVAADSNLRLNLDHKQAQLTSANLDYGKFLPAFYPPLNQVIHGRAETKASYNLDSGELTATSSLMGVEINAVNQLSKAQLQLAPLHVQLQNMPNKHKSVNLNYNNQLYAKADLNADAKLTRLNVALGTADVNLGKNFESAVITAKVNTDRFSLTQWAKFVRTLIPYKEATTDDGSGKSSGLAYSSSQDLHQVPIGKVTATTSKKAAFYPIALEIDTNGFFVDNYNLDRGKFTLVAYPQTIDAAITTPDIKGKASYYPAENYLNLHFQRLLFAESNFVPAKAHESLTAIQTMTQTESRNMALKLKSVSYPNVNLVIDNLYYQNHYLGKLDGNLYQESGSLYIESMNLTNNAATTTVSVSDNCLGCNNEYVAIIVRADIRDFGLLLNKLDQGNIFDKGTGVFAANLRWNGGFGDYSFEQLKGSASLEVKKGQLIKVNPGLLGSLFGVISLSNYATSFNPLNMNSFFGKGFAFDSLNTTVYLLNRNLKLEKLEMIGPIAGITTFGNLDLANNQIDTFMTVEPRLGGTIATTAGVVTLNPVVGIAVYAAQYIIGDPINKALAISYHITGAIESPTMQKTKISKQILNNFTSSLNIFDNLKSSLPQPAKP